MDSRDKRASAIHPSLPWRGLWPAPDGTIDAGDREHAASLYRSLGVVQDFEELFAARSLMPVPA
jgi:hypothetical protein